MTHNEVSALEESPKLQLTLRNHTGTLKAEKERKVTIFYNIFFFYFRKMANIDWDSLNAKLPLEKNDEDKAKRQELFKQFDPNGNGYLSLAEVQGIKLHHKLFLKILPFFAGRQGYARCSGKR